MGFPSVVNNAATTLAQPYTVGQGQITLASGYGAVLSAKLTALGLPAISASAPLLFTLVSASALNAYGQISDATKTTIYQATSLVGDVLSGLSVREGTTDQNFSIGDTFAVLMTAGELAALQSAVASLQSQTYFVLAGIPGGQVAKGGTNANDSLTLNSTANATKGFVLLGTDGSKVAVAQTSATAQLDVQSGSTSTVGLRVAGASGQTATDYFQVQTFAGQTIVSVGFAGSAPTLNMPTPAGATCFQLTTASGLAQIGTINNYGLSFYTNNISRWQIIGASGHITPFADNTYDIGSPGSVTLFRPRGIYATQTVGAGGFAQNQVAKTAAYTFTALDGTVAGNTTGGAFSVTLPTAANAGVGRRYALKKTDASANALTLAAQGGDKIDGAATFALAAQNKYVEVEADGVANWWVVSNN